VAAPARRSTASALAVRCVRSPGHHGMEGVRPPNFGPIWAQRLRSAITDRLAPVGAKANVQACSRRTDTSRRSGGQSGQSGPGRRRRVDRPCSEASTDLVVRPDLTNLTPCGHHRAPRSRCTNRVEVGRQIGPFRSAGMDGWGRTIDLGGDQLRGAYGTHDDANPCQTPTDAEYRSLSVVPCQVMN
jgi:hypothetical protein